MAEDIYQFKDEQERVEFYQFLKEVRCVTCQNQTLADSNAPIALTMRDEIYTLWNKETSQQEIKSILSERFGEYVLYSPTIHTSTYFLWGGPILFFIIGTWVFLRLFKSKR